MVASGLPGLLGLIGLVGDIIDTPVVQLPLGLFGLRLLVHFATVTHYHEQDQTPKKTSIHTPTKIGYVHSLTPSARVHRR
jgi:hypothetical protein